MNGLNASYGISKIVRYSVFWSKLTLFVSRLPKPNDSNDYCDRLIYLSCNDYLIFLVSLTSFKERGLQLPVTRKRRWAFWLVLLPYHEEIRVLCFSVTAGFLCRSCLCSIAESLPTTTPFFYIYYKIIKCRFYPLI